MFSPLHEFGTLLEGTKDEVRITWYSLLRTRLLYHRTKLIGLLFGLPIGHHSLKTRVCSSILCVSQHWTCEVLTFPDSCPTQALLIASLPPNMAPQLDKFFRQ